MLATEAAKFLILHATRLFLFVLGGRIISALALCAFQRNNISHNCTPDL